MVNRFYFPNLRKTVFELVKKCMACQVARPQSGKKPFTLQTTKLEPIPFSRVYLDFKGPLVQSNGFKFVLAILDSTTRFAITVPLRAVTAEIVIS